MEWWNDWIWNDGTMEWWNDVMMEWWNYGMMRWCNYGMMEWLYVGMMEWWNDGMMKCWNDLMMEQWNDGTMEWWNYEIVDLWSYWMMGWWDDGIMEWRKDFSRFSMIFRDLACLRFQWFFKGKTTLKSVLAIFEKLNGKNISFGTFSFYFVEIVIIANSASSMEMKQSLSGMYSIYRLNRSKYCLLFQL